MSTVRSYVRRVCVLINELLPRFLAAFCAHTSDI